MPEFTYDIEAEGLADPRLEELEDLYEALRGRPHILGPAVSGDLETGAIGLTVTVEADDAEAASSMAVSAFSAALVETGRTGVAARVTPAFDGPWGT